MHKKGHKLKTSPLVKNQQFSSNLADITQYVEQKSNEHQKDMGNTITALK